MARAFRIKVQHPGTPAATGTSERERFWNALAIRVGERSPRLTWHILARDAEGDFDDRKQIRDMYRELERELERYFPHRLLQVMWESEGDGGLGLELKFALFDIGYGSLELLLGALGIENTAAIYGIALPAVVSMIEASCTRSLEKDLRLTFRYRFRCNDVRGRRHTFLSSRAHSQSGQTPHTGITYCCHFPGGVAIKRILSRSNSSRSCCSLFCGLGGTRCHEGRNDGANRSDSAVCRIDQTADDRRKGRTKGDCKSTGRGHT